MKGTSENAALNTANPHSLAERILIVEDDSYIAYEVADQIKGFGYCAIGPVSTGEEAVSIAKHERPDLILFDIRLAGKIDGIDAAKQVRSELEIPVVYLTAHADDETLARANITEPYGYVLKPFSELELQTAIKLALLKAAQPKDENLDATQQTTQRKKPTPRVVSDQSQVGDESEGSRVLSILRQAPYVNSLDGSALKALVTTSTLEKVDAGKLLVLEGDSIVSGFLVVSGRLAMVKSSLSGRDFTVELLPAGDPFGLGVALAWDPYPVTVKAQVSSEVLWIPRREILELFETSHNFSKELTRDVFNRLRSAHNISRGLAHDRTDIRVATALLALAPRFANSEQEILGNCIPMTREQLADCIGCATETVVRVTKAMERDKLLDLSKRGRISVLDSQGLRELAGAEL